MSSKCIVILKYKMYAYLMSYDIVKINILLKFATCAA